MSRSVAAGSADVRRPHRPASMVSVVLALTATLVVALAIRTAAADAPDGRRIYAEQCSGCHGDGGRGDGPAAPGLVPRPRDFGDPAFWKDRTASEIEAVVRAGKPGTMMMAWAGVLSDAEIAAVVRFVEGFKPAAAH